MNFTSYHSKKGNIDTCTESEVGMHAYCESAMPGISPKGCSEEGVSE